MTDDRLLPFDLPAVSRKKVSADFAGGSISSDGGLVLLREVERRLGLAETLAGCIREAEHSDEACGPLPAQLRQDRGERRVGFVERGGRRPFEVDLGVARQILRGDESGEQRVIALGDDAGGHVEKPLAAREVRQGLVGVDADAMQVAVSVGKAAHPLGTGRAADPEFDGEEALPEAKERRKEDTAEKIGLAGKIARTAPDPGWRFGCGLADIEDQKLCPDRSGTTRWTHPPRGSIKRVFRATN